MVCGVRLPGAPFENIYKLVLVISDMKKEGKESSIKGNSLGASGFTLCIIGLLFLGWIGVVCSVTGFIFCLIQQKKKPTKLAKAGIVLGILGFILSLLFVFYLAPMINEWIQQNQIVF